MKNDIVIIGAGPVGLFTVFEAGLLGLNCTLIDNLDKPGGQCSELYPDKPIFDIPGVPYQTAQEHVDALLKQIEPFSYDLILNERVDELINSFIKNQIITKRFYLFKKSINMFLCCLIRYSRYIKYWFIWIKFRTLSSRLIKIIN